MARRVINGFLVIGMLLAMLPAAAQEDKLRLAFQQEGVKNAPSRVVVIFSTKANPKTLANRVELTGRHVTPALSPDGHTLAFAAQVGVKYQLFTWALDEYNTVVGAPKRLSPDANTDDKFPSWSPDGTQLAYLSTDDTKKAALCVINSDGTGRKVLESGNNVLAGYPSWRNDGKAILYIASANGKRVMRRVDPESAYPVTLSAPGPIAATFSPDGTQIAALVPGKAGDSSILVYNEAGTTAKAILGSIKRATCITWPLAQRIIFNGVQVGTRKGGPFWSIAPTGGDAKVFLAYGDPASASHFTVQTNTTNAPLPAMVDPGDAGDAGTLGPKERVNDGPVTIIRPYADAVIRGTVPIKVIAQQEVASIVLSIGDQFAYSAKPEADDDEVPMIVYAWNTQQMTRLEPSRDKLPAAYAKALRYPDGEYTLSVTALDKDNKVMPRGRDAIKVTVLNSMDNGTFPGNVILRYQYKEPNRQDEDYRIHGEGTLFGVEGNRIPQLDAALDVKMRRTLVETRKTGDFDLRTRLVLEADNTFPLSYGLNQATLPEEGKRALYAFSPSGKFSVVPQNREKIYLPLSQVAVPLPTDAVRIGFKWTANMWIVPDLLERQAVEAEDATHVVEGIEWIGDHKCVRIRSDYRLESKWNAIPLNPIQRAPGLFKPPATDPNINVTAKPADTKKSSSIVSDEELMQTALSSTIRIKDAIGVRYSWFDYEQNQLVRVEDMILYGFPLVNVPAIAATLVEVAPPTPTPTTPTTTAPGMPATTPAGPAGAVPTAIDPNTGLPLGWWRSPVGTIIGPDGIEHPADYNPLNPTLGGGGVGGYTAPITEGGFVPGGGAPTAQPMPTPMLTPTPAPAPPPLPNKKISKAKLGNGWYLVRWSYAIQDDEVVDTVDVDTP